MSIYEYFTSIYEYLRFVMIFCDLTTQSLGITTNIHTNFNFFYSKMGTLPYVWVRWNQNSYNLDIQMSYSYFRDPV